jgi:Zn-dependent protease with chaperone function
MASPSRSLVQFQRISPSSFQHYDDIRTTRTLQQLPVFSTALKFMSEKLLEKAAHLHHLSHCIRLIYYLGSYLYRAFLQSASTLSVPALPELYISAELSVNAYALGMKQYTIVLTRGLIERMTETEIMAVMGHELGHVKCEHMVYKTMASLIAEFGVGRLAEEIPLLGPTAVLALQAHLMDWSRKAELTCDRAALLVVQDATVVATMLAKLGGWAAPLGNVNLQCLVDQAHDYDALDNESVSSALKMIQQLQSSVYLTHPLPIHRVQSILRWSESDQYRAILDGRFELDPNRKIVFVCSNCGQELSAKRPRFCDNCGADLSQPGAVLER